MKKFSIYVMFFLTILIVNSGCSMIINENMINKYAGREDTAISELLNNGFVFDESKNGYVNKKTGIWYVVRDGYIYLPAEEYVSPK